MRTYVKAWTVKVGDTLPLISYKVYGDSRLWRLIADANRIDNPLLFPELDHDLGRHLTIPKKRKK